MQCSKAADPIWSTALMKKQETERKTRTLSEKRKMPRFKSIDVIYELLNDDGTLIGCSMQGNSSSKEVTPDQAKVYCIKHFSKKRRLFGYKNYCMDPDPSLPQFWHVRDPERKVKDAFYLSISYLIGNGLSVAKPSDTVLMVANGVFGRNWENFRDNQDSCDVDTLPSIFVRIRYSLQLIEAKSSNLITDKAQKASISKQMIIHAINSTTRKTMGQFAVQIIHNILSKI